MKYIVVTSKHHDGFAMYDSDAISFNIVDATPFGRDPMKELSEACRKFGLEFGFYYSHSQDWTYPGTRNGPPVDENGNPATFDDYFYKKCLPQVEEITSNYGPIEIVWFDTPGGMSKDYVQQLVDVVGGQHIQNQQNASHVYHEYPIGWLNFPASGRYQVAVSCLEESIESAKLKSIRIVPVNRFPKC